MNRKFLKEQLTEMLNAEVKAIGFTPDTRAELCKPASLNLKDTVRVTLNSKIIANLLAYDSTLPEDIIKIVRDRFQDALQLEAPNLKYTVNILMRTRWVREILFNGKMKKFGAVTTHRIYGYGADYPLAPQYPVQRLHDLLRSELPKIASMISRLGRFQNRDQNMYGWPTIVFDRYKLSLQKISNASQLQFEQFRGDRYDGELNKVVEMFQRCLSLSEYLTVKRSGNTLRIQMAPTVVDATITINPKPVEVPSVNTVTMRSPLDLEINVGKVIDDKIIRLETRKKQIDIDIQNLEKEQDTIDADILTLHHAKVLIAQ